MRINRHMRHSLAMLLMAFACLVSCNDLKEETPGVVGTNAVLMRIMQAPEEPLSKAGTNLTEEENAINSLRIYAFTRGQRVGYHYQPSSVKSDFLMELGMFGTDASTGMQTVKFYIIVNEDAMVTEENMPVLDRYTTESQLNEYRFFALNQGKGLPMFYADTVMINTSSHAPMSSVDTDRIDITGHENHTLLARKLSFLLKRPFGKLTFSAAKTSSSVHDVYVKSISMLAKGTRQYNYMMPQPAEVLESVMPRMNDRVLLDEETGFVVTQTQDEGLQQISESYCFEVPFGSDSPDDWNVPNQDNSVVLKTVFSVGMGEELRTAYIYLPPVLRNQWIRVGCIISGEGQIKVNYHVRDWDYEMNDMDGDGEEDYIIFDYPTHTYLLPELPSASNPSPDPDGAVKVLPQMSMSEPFTCYFQMRYPAGQTWKPTIFAGNAPSSDFRVSVYMNDTGTMAQTDQGGSFGINAGNNEYFRIEVQPLNALNVGASIYFGITAEIQGFGHSEYLLINGIRSDVFWPAEGGSDPNALIITQTE